jgi:hypothetical protein
MSVKRISGLDAAAAFLAACTNLKTAQEIASAAIERGWKTKGATPSQTIYAAITREIKAGKDSRFRQTGPNQFAAATATVADCCPHGHPFTPDNTYCRPGSKHRECKTCKRAREKAARQ